MLASRAIRFNFQHLLRLHEIGDVPVDVRAAAAVAHGRNGARATRATTEMTAPTTANALPQYEVADTEEHTGDAHRARTPPRASVGASRALAASRALHTRITVGLIIDSASENRTEEDVDPPSVPTRARSAAYLSSPPASVRPPSRETRRPSASPRARSTTSRIAPGRRETPASQLPHLQQPEARSSRRVGRDRRDTRREHAHGAASSGTESESPVHPRTAPTQSETGPAVDVEGACESRLRAPDHLARQIHAQARRPMKRARARRRAAPGADPGAFARPPTARCFRHRRSQHDERFAAHQREPAEDGSCARRFQGRVAGRAAAATSTDRACAATLFTARASIAAARGAE